MREMVVVLILLFGSIAGLGFLIGGAAAQMFEPIPKPWTVGMEWSWDGPEAEEKLWVHEETDLQTPSGRYDVFIHKGRHIQDDGTYKFRMLAFLEGSHRRAYEEIHTTTTGGDQVTQTISYDPPVPFPFWERMEPGKMKVVDSTTTTNTMVGLTPVGQETTEWRWVAKADEETREMTTPAGTFEGYQVSIFKKNQDTGNVTEHRFFYAPEVRHYQAILDGNDDPTLGLTDFTLDPPPVAHGRVIPSLPVAGEPVVLDASNSYDRNGNLTDITWTLPDGTTRQGTQINHTFTEAGRFRLTLSVTDDHHQTTEIPVPVRVVEPGPRLELIGPDVAIAKEPTPYRLVVPEEKTARQITWNGPGLETQHGTDVEIVFPQAGGYKLTVSFLDSDGNTARLTHGVTVFGDRDGAGTSSGQPGQTDRAGQELESLPPAILEPTNNTRFDRDQILVVARVASMEDPAIVLGNGLRVPLASAGGIATAEVPITGERTVLELHEGHDPIDRVVVLRDAPQRSTDTHGDQEASSQEIPLGILPAVLTLTFIAVLRRRDP